MPKRWLSTARAAEHLGIAKSSLYMLVCLGTIPAYRPTPGSRSVRFKVEDLDAYLESVRVQPGDLLHLLDDQVRDQLRRLLDDSPGQARDGEGCAGAGLVERFDSADAVGS